MINALRQRHRRMTIFLALAAPAVLAVALLARPPAVTGTALPGVASRTPPAGVSLLAEDSFPLAGATLRVRLFADDLGARSVELSPAPGDAVNGADVLVYWQREEPGDAVPDGARLLGTLAGRQTRVFPMPRDASGGALVFYSLAQQNFYDAHWPVPE